MVDESGAVIAGLQRTARNLGYWPFRHCYEEGLRRDQSLTGTVSLDLLVSPEASARRTELQSSTVKDGVVTACVAREAHHIVFDPVASPIAAKLRVLLALGDEPVPLALGFPGGKDLRAELRSHWPEAASCFEASLSRHPDAGGRIELRFDLDDDGALSQISEVGARYPDTATTECVAAVYRRAQLTSPPAVRGGPSCTRCTSSRRRPCSQFRRSAFGGEAAPLTLHRLRRAPRSREGANFGRAVLTPRSNASSAHGPREASRCSSSHCQKARAHRSPPRRFGWMRSFCRSSLVRPPMTASLSKKRHGAQWSWMTCRIPVSGFHMGGVIQTHDAPVAAIFFASVSTARACISGTVMSASLAPRVTMTSAGRRESHSSNSGLEAHVVVYVDVAACTT